MSSSASSSDAASGYPPAVRTSAACRRARDAASAICSTVASTSSDQSRHTTRTRAPGLRDGQPVLTSVTSGAAERARLAGRGADAISAEDASDALRVRLPGCGAGQGWLGGRRASCLRHAVGRAGRLRWLQCRWMRRAQGCGGWRGQRPGSCLRGPSRGLLASPRPVQWHLLAHRCSQPGCPALQTTARRAASQAPRARR